MLKCNIVRYLLAAVVLLIIAHRRGANGEKIDARIDVGLILAFGSDNSMHVVPNAYKKLVEHFKLGEDSVRVAIYSAVWTIIYPKKVRPRVVLNLTADEQSIQQGLESWISSSRDNWTLHLDIAFNATHQLLRINTTEGDERAKAVVVVLTAFNYNATVAKKANNAAKTLRDEGVWIYVVAPQWYEYLRIDAKKIAENDERVFLVSSEISDAHSAEVRNIMDQLADAIRNDLSRSVSGSAAETSVTGMKLSTASRVEPSAASPTPPRSSTTEEGIAPWVGPVVALSSFVLVLLVIVITALIVIAVIDRKRRSSLPKSKASEIEKHV